MAVKELKPGICGVGAVDWDRRLFEELVPTPYGTSYNSYLVRGSEKTALIDTVDPAKTHELMHNLRLAGADRIDFVVCQHAEQDHSGSIPEVLKAYPEAKVVTNPRCKEILMSHLQLTEDRFVTVADEETLHLGGRTLRFIYTPWVHWPETMCTYIPEDAVLFSCDFLGTHFASGDLFWRKHQPVRDLAKRYFALIMMPLREEVIKNLDKIQPLKPAAVAPSHGPVHAEPARLISAYHEWASDKVSNEICLPFVSMHGSTRKMAEHFTDAALARGIGVKPFNLTCTDIAELGAALVDAASLVAASPTVLRGPHPVAANAVLLIRKLKPKTRFGAVIGSYGWGTKVVEQICGFLSDLEIEMLEPVLAKGDPGPEAFAALDRLADTLAAKHNALGLR
ncbi:MAG: FprA family A-type flavoprotein [Firmicutes bacterium]|nr:FprA family A-type flavoprotein [Bacillota bacterium]